MGGYTKEADMIPLLEKLFDIFVKIEKKKFCVVDGERYDVFIREDSNRHDVSAQVHRARCVLCIDHIFLHVLLLHDQVSS